MKIKKRIATASQLPLNIRDYRPDNQKKYQLEVPMLKAGIN